MEKDTYRSQFRLPQELYEKLKASADEKRLSVNAELVSRLEQSFSQKAIESQDIDKLVNEAIDHRLKRILDAPGRTIFSKLINATNEDIKSNASKHTFLIETKGIKNAALTKVSLKPDNFPDLSSDFIAFIKNCYHNLRTDHVTIECKDGVPGWLGKALKYFAGYGYPMDVVGLDIPEEIKAALKDVRGSQCPQYSWDDVPIAEQNTHLLKKPK